MSKTPIPDDWDGEDWCCFVVEWPNSQGWRAILRGALLLPTKGRFWDEDTGIVTDAQEVGREIEDRNCLFIEPGGA